METKLIPVDIRDLIEGVEYHLDNRTGSTGTFIGYDDVGDPRFSASRGALRRYGNPAITGKVVSFYVPKGGLTFWKEDTNENG